MEIEVKTNYLWSDYMKHLLLFFSFLVLFGNAKATAVYTACPGDWNNPNSWLNGVLPGKGDSIYVRHSLKLTQTVTFDSNYVHLNKFGAICGNEDIFVPAGAKLNSQGTININNNFVHFEGGTHKLGYFKGYTTSSGGPTRISQSGFTTFYNSDQCLTKTTFTSCAPKSFVSPSGKYNYDKTGLYIDTVLSAGGCDSVIAVEVFIDQNELTYAQVKKCNSFRSPSYKYTWYQTGTYQDTIKSIMGCDSILEIDLEIEKCACSFYIPNAMTSNNDGANDAFYVQGDCPKTYFQFDIFDRNGIKVFSSNSVYQGWDGTYQGQLAPQGVYVYFLNIQRSRL